MGYFDKVTETLFKTGENGEIIYYPNGVFGKGRVVPDEDKKNQLFKHQKRVNKYFVTFSCLYGFLVGLSGQISLETLMPILVVYLFVYIRQKTLIRGLAVYNSKLTLKETTKSLSKAYHPAFLLFMVVNGIILILLSFAIPFIINKPVNEALFLILVPFSVGIMSLAVFWYLYKTKKSNN